MHIIRDRSVATGKARSRAVVSVLLLVSCIAGICFLVRTREALDESLARHVARWNSDVIVERRHSPMGDTAARAPLESVEARHSEGGTIRVVAEDGEPVSGAVVYLAGREDFRRLGSTDSGGALRAQIDLSGAEVLVADAPGFVARSVDPPPETFETFEVVLKRQGEASGFVLVADGRPAGPDIEVLAWQEIDELGPSLVRRARNKDPRTIWARTDGQGAFVLEGLDPDRQYQAVAGGKGYAQTPLDKPTVFRAGARIELVVERAYAGWVRLREVDRTELRISPHLYGRRYGTVRPSDPALRRATGSSIHAMLAIAGVPESASTLRDRFYVFTSRHGRETSGPISIDLDFPGYERSRATFELPAFDGENPAEIFVELVPLSQERAALEAVFGADLFLLDSIAVVEPVGVVRLTGPEGRPCEYAVRNRIPAAFVIADLPIGDYDWEFETLDGSFRVPPSGPGRVQIGREGGRIEVDVYELGAIDLDIRWLDGSRFRGAASIVCSPIGDAHSPARIFRCPPYQVAALVPGVYEVWVDVPRFLDRRRETARAAGVTVSVQPSQVSQAELVLGE